MSELNAVNLQMEKVRNNKVLREPSSKSTADDFFSESDLFKGYFRVDGGMLSSSSFKASDTKKEIITYNDDGTVTLQTYYSNDNGTDNIVDEITDIYFEERDLDGFCITTPEIARVEFDVDKNIDYFEQGRGVGDCGFLSSLVSLSGSEKGMEILDNMITINDDKSYSVTFGGIDKTVLITQEELAQARKSAQYSIGDNTVLLLEYGAEKAIREYIDDFGVTNDDITNYYTNKADDKTADKVEQMLKSSNVRMILEWMTYEYESPIDGFSLDDFCRLLGFSEECRSSYLNNGTEDSTKELLDNIDFDNSINMLTFDSEANLTSNKGKKFEILTNHAYAITNYNIEDGTATIVNPHDTSDSLTITIPELKQYGSRLWVCNF